MTNKCTTCGGPVTVHKGTRSVFDNMPAVFVINLKEQLELKDKQLEVMREALEYYGDDKFYFPRSIIQVVVDKGWDIAPVYSDFGDTAKEALTKCKEVENV